MIARKVEWRNAFRDFKGVVVEHTDRKCVVSEFNDLEQYTIAEDRLKVVGMGVVEYVEYHRRVLTESLAPEEEWTVHDIVIAKLEVVPGDSKVTKSINDAIANEIKLKAAAKRVNISSASDKKFSARFDVGEKKSDAKGVPALKNDVKPTSADVASSGEEDSEDDDGSNGSDDEDEDSGDDEEESSDDDEDEDESSEDTDDSDEEDDDDDEEEEKVDIKVYVLPSNDIRGFAVPLSKAGLKTIAKALTKDYDAPAGLFFRDSDGDVVTIKSAHDLKYAYRSAQAAAGATSTNAVKLKLFAEVAAVGATTTASSTGSNSHSVTPLPGADRGDTAYPLSLEGSTAQFAREEEVRTSNTGSMSNTFANTNRALGMSVTTSLDMDSILQESGQHRSLAANSPVRGALNYEVLWKKGELLGSGSFGKVYSGINLSTGERIAVKEVALRRGKKRRQQAQALQQEVKILSSLDHPNIIRYLGTEYTKQTLRIFLELANDGTVRDAINEFGAFPEPLVRRYAADILEGLHFLHSKKFIHRDIKPTNLLVSAGRVKLGDFGCSSVLSDDETGFDGASGTCTVAGTAVYMAPEVMQAGDSPDLHALASQAAPRADAAGSEAKPSREEAADKAPDNRVGGSAPKTLGPKKTSEKSMHKRSATAGKKGYGKRADIWSVGITLCEMALGKVPFANAGAAIYAVCVSKKFPGFPDEFTLDAHRFLDRCLVEDPKARANCGELRDLPFLSVQTMDAMRAQTAASMPKTAHTASTVTVHLPADFSFLKSPRDDDGEGEDAGAHFDGHRSRHTNTDMFATGRSAFGTDNVRGGPVSMGSSNADMFRSVRGHGVDPAARLYANDTYDEHQYATARSISQEDEMFEKAAVYLPHAGPSGGSEDSADMTIQRQRAPPKDANIKSGEKLRHSTAKDVEEDEDCKTGRSTMTSTLGRYF